MNGDYRHNESFTQGDYPSMPGGAHPSFSRVHRQQPRSGRTSVNGEYRPLPEDDLEMIDGDMASLSGVGGNSILHSTHYNDRDRPPTQSGMLGKLILRDPFINCMVQVYYEISLMVD